MKYIKKTIRRRDMSYDKDWNLKSAVDFEYHYHFLTLATYLMCDDNRNSDADNRLQWWWV